LPIPLNADLRLPLLKIAADGAEHSNSETVAVLAQQLGLTADERAQLTPSGTDRLFDNRVRWAKVALRKAGLLDIPSNGLITITERGRELLEERPLQIDDALLKRYPEFLAWRALRNKTAITPDGENDDDGGEVQGTTSASPLRFCLFRTMSEYIAAKTEPQKDHEFATWFRGLAQSLPLAVPDLREYKIDSSVGHSGNWAFIPWISIRRPDLAPTLQSGVFLSYLFSSDMTTVYLSLGQGASDMKAANKARLEDRAMKVRTILDVSDQRGTSAIDLKPGSALGHNYEAGHIVGIRYERDALPLESILAADLKEMLGLYTRLTPELLQETLQESTGPVTAGPTEAGEVIPGEVIPVAPELQPYTFENLLDDTLWARRALEKILKVMVPLDPARTTRQVILAGPPGSGKTWVAKHLVKHAAGNDPSRSRLVQFHPSYSYEQFIEGLQPVVRQGAVTFEVVPGIVRQIAAKAADDVDKYFLIVDEINRANLPRVFGKLMYLLEYRNEEVLLPYSGAFKLPANLAFIGTMNTADRSIRSIDLALRRRFDIFPCEADPEILSRYYSSELGLRVNQVDDLIDGFVALNEFLVKEIDAFHTIGHTFFMSKRFTHDDLRDVWERQIAPTLGEYFFDAPRQVGFIKLEQFWKSTY
jgi:hypothetical protein